MINYLAKQTFQTIPTNREQMSRLRKVGVKKKKKFPFVSYTRLAPVFLQKYSETSYIHTHLDKSKVAWFFITGERVGTFRRTHLNWW